MGLDNLLAKMEQRATATPETPCNLAGVSAKPAPVKACTLATPETPQIINAVVNVKTSLPEAANDPAPGTRHFRWLVHYPDRDPEENTFTPELTHAEVLAWKVGAIAAEPIPERTRQTATPEQEAELRALAASVAAPQGFTHDELEEARTVAMRDPLAAIECYRELAGELGLSHRDGGEDDRHFCGECANLISGRCAQARRGLIPGASMIYSPAQDVMGRCDQFKGLQ